MSTQPLSAMTTSKYENINFYRIYEKVCCIKTLLYTCKIYYTNTTLHSWTSWCFYTNFKIILHLSISLFFHMITHGIFSPFPLKVYTLPRVWKYSVPIINHTTPLRTQILRCRGIRAATLLASLDSPIKNRQFKFLLYSWLNLCKSSLPSRQFRFSVYVIT